MTRTRLRNKFLKNGSPENRQFLQTKELLCTLRKEIKKENIMATLMKRMSPITKLFAKV